MRFDDTRPNVVEWGNMDGTSVNFTIVPSCTIDSKSQTNTFIRISGRQKRYLIGASMQKQQANKNYRGMEKDLALKPVLRRLCVISLLGGHGD